MNKLQQLFADIIKLLNRFGPTYINGLKNTLVLALVATFIGCVIGFICGIITTIPVSKKDNWLKKVFLAIVRTLIRIYVEVFRGTPMVLQAVFIYYGLPYFNLYRFTNMWVAAILIVSINTGAYMAETVRGGIMSIDAGQFEAAKALGMNHFTTMTQIILPQALRSLMPQIGNNFIINIKDTSILFIIGFTDFFAIHRAAVGATYLYFPSATVEMVGYLFLTLISSFILRRMEKALEGSSDYQLVQVDSITLGEGNYNYPGKANPLAEQSKEFKEGGKW